MATLRSGVTRCEKPVPTSPWARSVAALGARGKPVQVGAPPRRAVNSSRAFGS